MTSRLGKTKRKTLAESDKDDDSESENCGIRKSARTDQRKKKDNRTKNVLYDTDSSSDKEVDKRRLTRSSKATAAKTICDIITVDLANSDSTSPKRSAISKQNKKEPIKRKKIKIYSDTSSEVSLESPEKHNISKDITMSSSKTSSDSKNQNKSNKETSLVNSARSSSKKLKELTTKKGARDSFGECKLNDYSVIVTPSRINEKETIVESAQEISFKHYVIQEIKKLQKITNKLNEDLQLSSEYLLKKRIGSIEDAKFFIHKILKFYEDTFLQCRENRKEFIKIYEGWINDIQPKPEDTKQKHSFGMSFDESEKSIDSSIDKQASTDELKENDKLAAIATPQIDSTRSNTNETLDSDDSIAEKLSRIQNKVKQVSLVTEEPNESDTTKDGDAHHASKDHVEPTSKISNNRLKLDVTNLNSDNNESVESSNDPHESDNDSVIEGSGCDSDLIFSSEESKSKRNHSDKKKRDKTSENVNEEEQPIANDTQLSDSQDLFDTSTGEVANTPKKLPAVIRIPSDFGDQSTVEKSLRSRDESEQPSMPQVESNELDRIKDAEEREAFEQLKALMEDDSDMNADSESESMEIRVTASSSAKSAMGVATQERKKLLTKQIKKRHLVFSDSSSSDDGEESRSKRCKRKKTSSTDGSALLRTAMAPRKKDSLDLRNNQFYLTYVKLRQNCRVKLERLPKSELVKHTRALRKSKIYIERKKIESLANLDNLESKKKSKKSSRAAESSESDADIVRETQNKKNRKQDEQSSTADDYLNKTNDVESNESSDENGGCENSITDDESVNQNSSHDVEKEAKEKLFLAMSSSSDELVENETELIDESKKTKAKEKEVKQTSSTKDDSGEEETRTQESKNSWRKDKLLTFKLDGSETEEDKVNKSQEKKKAMKSDTERDKSQEDASPIKKIRSTRKTRKTRRILDSDSDVQSISEDPNETSSDEKSVKDTEQKNKMTKRQRGTHTSDSDSLSNEKKQTSKRKRIKKVATDSESDEKDSPGKGRKNIRKVLKDKYVTDDTRKAAQDEEDRLKRIAERQKLFEDMYEKREAGEEKVSKLVLDVDEETKEELVIVDQGLAKRLKPHQARGIKFMWDACFESIEQIKTSEGSGCIIAHCMGLGKTFQVVTLAHTLLCNERTGVHTVMIVCPLSTVLNWVNEFNIWLKHVNAENEIEIHEMTKLKKNIERKIALEQWQRRGGVLIIGYEMFRNLTSTGKKMKKNMQESVMRSLVDPGADLVVCDEGHLLKNEDSALSKAMKIVKTMRRIVLTGTPLQNNLKEYHCMVQFVKPNLLGTKKEFLNRFVNPITNGQFDDSTPYDVKLMKKRAHVLHKMLEGSVQRFDYSVLTPFLPPKSEYVIFVRLTEVQIKMYQHYLNHLSRRHTGRNVSLFADFQALQRIWTHPYVLYLNAEKVEKANEKKRLEASDSEGSLKDFIDDDSTSVSEISSNSASSSNSDVECLDSDTEKGATIKKRGTRANPIAEEPVEQAEEPVEEAAWWSQFIDEQHFNDLRISTKLMLLFAILKESESIGDKVLVFSQSLYSLTLIEHFLNLMDEQSQMGGDAEHLNGHTGSWALGMDYFRLDGSTSAENRNIWSKIFNNPNNTRARLFLISTRAGGLGINLIGANRVIIFDASWNPSHDVQSIFRIYRFGQKKPCFVYRFLAAGTMEEKIYNRQVTKLSLACRVVDEQQIERHYSNTDLAELYQFETCENQSETLNLPKDRLLAEIFIKYKESIVKCHEHDSLLENKEEEELDEDERKQAWIEYEEEKKGIRQTVYNNVGNDYAFNQMVMNINPEVLENVKQSLQIDYPNVPPDELGQLAQQVFLQMYHVRQAALNTSNYNAQLPMAMPNAFINPTIQEEIFRQQNIKMNQPQMNYYGMNYMPAYSGRGRPPKYTSVNNQIVTNPMFSGNIQALQQQLSVPNNSEVQILNEESITSSSKQTTSNTND